jgi:endogenous inhibitor of DNA gyrase (YacG/DUF329 family)
MNSYSMYELKCPTCGTHYMQMISRSEEELHNPCPSCDTELEKVRKLTGAELLSCVSSYGGT